MTNRPQETSSSAMATEAELALLQALWRGGASAIRPLCVQVYGRDDSSRYATVQKLLERLEAKGLVRRDRSQAVHVFEAAVDRDEFLGERLRALANTLCGGSWTPILTHLAQGVSLSPQDRRSLRDLVDRLDADSAADAGEDASPTKNSPKTRKR